MLSYRFDGGEFISPNIDNYPDGTMKIDLAPADTCQKADIRWLYENELEQMQLFFIMGSLKDRFPKAEFTLFLPYLPNARMDRVHADTEVFTLKYFARFINSMGFDKVYVLDVHSSVGAALIDRCVNISPEKYIRQAMEAAGFSFENDYLFFPDEGSMKRYSSMFNGNHVGFGIKKRDWSTGRIMGLEVEGDDPTGKNVFIIDDICAYGGTVFYSANKLKELGCADINVYFSHCENSIAKGRLFGCGMIKNIYTTNSICTLPENDILRLIEL
ncbi:ribose-phosphate pyrophosphokinase [Ruminococcus sp.]|uniref:ribose-phosphate pyrophosphokinase n=1 Tax=Ruminococcus sp. TaxID=41978 RepID=UPI0025E5A0AC|nr:ribose-phosphate pyrophosphokinase [Ruminococcus sp.]MBQ8968008.1 ribose-phosphate pyrophosphokinase [Ruminococcus sp.]